MPSINRRVCTTHGIYSTKSCEQCKSQRAKTYNEQSRNKDSAKIYNTRRWQKLREAKFMNNPLCKCGEIAQIADHIIEIVDGGEAFSIDNLESMCRACHNTKTAAVRRERT